MADAVKTTNVVKSTNKKGLLGKLEDLETGYRYTLFCSYLEFECWHVMAVCHCLAKIAHFTVCAGKLSNILCISIIRLALCEKALAEYLETKRLAFPRFYFVSSADLLDILSNGNNPVEVVFKKIHQSTDLCFEFLENLVIFVLLVGQQAPVQAV